MPPIGNPILTSLDYIFNDSKKEINLNSFMLVWVRHVKRCNKWWKPEQKRDAVKRHKNRGPIWPIINNIAAKLKKNEGVFFN